jgi:quinol monooxygenase YgiN
VTVQLLPSGGGHDGSALLAVHSSGRECRRYWRGKPKEEWMAIRLVVSFQAAPGKRDDFVRAFEPLRQITVAEDGCEQYELFTSTEDADRVVLLERWTNAELLEKHMEGMRARGGSPTSAFVAEGSRPGFERYEV